MSEPKPPKPPDANDVLRSGGELSVVGEPIVVSMEAFRAKRERPAAVKSAAGGAPPSSGSSVAGPGDGGGDDRPRIVVSTEEAQVNEAAVAALSRIKGVYVRGNALVRVIRARDVGTTKGDPDAPAIDPVPREMLQEHLSSAARFVKMVPTKESKDGDEKEWNEVPQHPPRWCVGAVHTRGAWPGLQHLRGVVEVPVLRADGSVLRKRGYDQASELLLLGNGPVEAPPEKPTADDVKAALALLEDVVCDALWAHPAHRSTWLASVLTPLARAAFDGPAPLFLYEAPVAGTGKGLFVDVAVRIATGRPAAFDTFTSDDAEMRKQIVTWAAGGRTVVVLDEVEKRFDGAALRSAITAPTVAGRVLGLSKEWSGPNLITWFATGNNIQKGKEMFRRIAPVQILSPVEDPSQRANFRHADLRAYVAEKRRELTRAALTILCAYHAAGRPDQKLSSWGSFPSWGELVRAAIVWAGWPDPADATRALRDEDTRQASYRVLVEKWLLLVSMMNRGPVSAKDALKYLMADNVPAPLIELREVMEEVALDKDGKPSALKLGYVLRSIKGAVFSTKKGVVRLESKAARAGTLLWTAVVVAPTGGDGGDGGDVSAPTRSPPETLVVNSEGGDLSPPSPPSPPSPSEEKREEEDYWGWERDDD